MLAQKTKSYLKVIEEIEAANESVNMDRLVMEFVDHFLPRLEVFAKRKLGMYHDHWQFIVYQSLLAVIKKIQKKEFDHSRSERLPSYIKKAVQNKAYNFIRSMGKVQFVELSSPELNFNLQSKIEELEIEGSQRSKKIWQCLEAIPNKYRDVIKLSYWKKLPAKRIKEKLNLSSEQEVYNIKNYALKKMKECLGGDVFFETYF